jgi:hypothetical protein
MKGQNSLLPAVLGILAGVSAVAGGLYAHSAQPSFGYAHFFGLHSQYLSAVHVLVGLGIIMILAGIAALWRPGLGSVIVSLAAVVGLIYLFDRGQYHWKPLLYYWAAPWVLAWLTGIFAGYRTFATVTPIGKTGDATVVAKPAAPKVPRVTEPV